MWFWITLKMWHTVTYPIRWKVSQYNIVFTEMISMFCKLLAFFLLLQSHCTRPSVQLQCIEIGGIETTILLPISLSLSGQEGEKNGKLQELDNKNNLRLFGSVHHIEKPDWRMIMWYSSHHFSFGVRSEEKLSWRSNRFKFLQAKIR